MARNVFKDHLALLGREVSVMHAMGTHEHLLPLRRVMYAPQRLYLVTGALRPCVQHHHHLHDCRPEQTKLHLPCLGCRAAEQPVQRDAELLPRHSMKSVCCCRIHGWR